MNDCIKQKNIDEGEKNLGASMVVEGFPRKIKKLNINVQRLILIIHSGGVAAAFLSSSGEDHKKIRIFFFILNILARTVGPMDKV